jgi:flagellar hook protein FlgE
MGLGANTSSINHDFSQGGLEVTGNQRDLAIEGNGFFVMRTGIEGVFNYAYTRDGAFYLGTDNTLLGGEGLHVQGYAAEDGVVPENQTLSDLTIPIGQTGAAQETTEMSLTGNLNSDVEVATPNSITTYHFAGTTTGTTSTSSWLAGAGTAAGASNTINVGHVQTSAALGDASGTTTTTASLNTSLEDLVFQRGTGFVQPFANIDTAADQEVTIDFRKGGRRMSATFTYGAGTNGDGTTINEFMRFLNGGVGDDGSGGVERLTGGAMGTVRMRARTSGVDGYDAPSEQAGAYGRFFDDATDTRAVDYSGNGTLEDTFAVSIASNLGEENAITDIEISYNNINYTDIFAADSNYGTVTGGSTTTNMIVYDSLGNPQDVTMQLTLVNRDTNFSTWRWIADSTDDTDATWEYNNFNPNGTNTTQANINVGTGLIRFDSQGRYIRGAELSETNGISIDLNNQGVNEPLSISITEGLSSTLDQSLDFSALTQVATDNDANLKEQNGSPPGTLDSFTVTTDGVINGVFSNGVLEVMGQIGLALVPNPLGLNPTGQNMFFEGANSGEPQIGRPEVGGRGLIRAGTLEQSNVDLSEEFTNLIVTQRGFQGNARVISTSDEMLVELVNLKR